MVTDTLPSSSDATGVCRWVDTDCMLVDALTKQMSQENNQSRVLVKKRDKQRQRIAGRDQHKEKEQQVQRQMNETHAEVMGSNDPESYDDDSPGALGDADWNDGA